MAHCEHCHSANIRRTQPGLAFDEYLCRECRGTFKRVSPMAKRMALRGCLTVLTLGVDGGLLAFLADGLDLFGDF